MKNKIFLTLAFLLFITTGSFAAGLLDTIPDGADYKAPQAKSAPVIDGNGNDACWNDAPWAYMNHIWIGNALTPTDYNGRFKILWTPQRLYVLMEIVDDSLCLQPNTTVSQCYNYDMTEIFIDEDYSHETSRYDGGYNAIAYHISTVTGVNYAMSNGWVSLTDNLNFQMSRVGTHKFHWENELKVVDKNFVLNGTNTPVTLTAGKVMGLSLAYNDNDLKSSSARQNMIGSVYINLTDKNVSYYNCSIFGKVTLVSNTTKINQTSSDLSLSNMYYSDHKIKVQLANANVTDVNFKLFDLYGKELKNIPVQNSSKNTVNDVDVSNLPNGIYLARVSNSQQQISKKIIIQSN